MSRILPRFNRIQEHINDQRHIARLILDAGPTDTPPTTTRATLPGDRRRLRGIPVAGGATGTSPGTDPLAALLAKERRT